MGSHEVWSGGVSDTHYMQHSEVFKSFNEYLLTSPFEDDATRDIHFTLMLDRGYRVTIKAHNEGGHYVLQPIFSDVDRQFTTEETHISSTVATDRSGNERAVKYLKHSDHITKGLRGNACSNRLSNTGLGWGYQVNFMYLSVQ
jgi:hypothetical protein